MPSSSSSSAKMSNLDGHGAGLGSGPVSSSSSSSSMPVSVRVERINIGNNDQVKSTIQQEQHIQQQHADHLHHSSEAPPSNITNNMTDTDNNNHDGSILDDPLILNLLLSRFRYEHRCQEAVDEHPNVRWFLWYDPAEYERRAAEIQKSIAIKVQPMEWIATQACMEVAALKQSMKLLQQENAELRSENAQLHQRPMLNQAMATATASQPHSRPESESESARAPDCVSPASVSATVPSVMRAAGTTVTLSAMESSSSSSSSPPMQMTMQMQMDQPTEEEKKKKKEKKRKKKEEEKNGGNECSAQLGASSGTAGAGNKRRKRKRSNRKDELEMECTTKQAKKVATTPTHSSSPSSSITASASASAPTSPASSSTLHRWDEISIALCMRYLGWSDVLSAASTCKQWRAASGNPIVWRLWDGEDEECHNLFDDQLSMFRLYPSLNVTMWDANWAFDQIGMNIQGSPNRSVIFVRHRC